VLKQYSAEAIIRHRLFVEKLRLECDHTDEIAIQIGESRNIFKVSFLSLPSL
jgi:hypothetical protein